MRSPKIVPMLPVILLAFLFMPINAYALATAWQGDDAVQVRLLSGVDGVGQQTTIPLGLDIKLSSDWHTYWRSPGEAGIPPMINWSKSETDAGNLKSATLIYTAPKRYTAFGMETIGYRDHVLLPIDAELRAPGKPLNIDAQVDLLVCSQLCLPKHFNVTLTIPQGPATEGAEAALIKQARDQVPGDSAKSGLEVKSVSTDGQSLTVDVVAHQPLQAPDIFVENDKSINFSAPSIDFAPDKLSAKFTVKPVMPLPDDVKFADLPYTFTVVDGDHALEKKASTNFAAPVATMPKEPAAAVPQVTNLESPPLVSGPPAPVLPLGLAILFAIIGGFILNLMPCVLPVLSLKILSVVSHGGGDPRLVLHSFLVTAVGIWFSFMALALAAIVLGEAGHAAGWGVQFQQPVYLSLLVLLLTFFTANMWGLFEIRLPRWLADSLTGPYHPKLAGDFATGAFATLLATPCSAPFLGTAIGFALASGPQEILAIFAALGFGMTLPYLAVAFMPRLATALPKPGAWMVHLRHLLGWALAATAAWLIWVLAAQISLRGALVTALCMLAILGLLALHRISPRSYIKFGIASFAIMAFGTALSGSLAGKPAAAIDANWRSLNEAEIARDVGEGKTVFVDVTAGWCLTCKANMKFVLSRDDIRQRLFNPDVMAMQADWTNPDPVIAAFLKKYGRYGIPFNAVFGPGAPQGIVLPELLTPALVTEALDKAAKSP